MRAPPLGLRNIFVLGYSSVTLDVRVMGERIAGIAVVVVIALAGSARADEAAARDAYHRAEALANTKRWAEACPLFAASYRADPQIGVLLHLANCHEQIGRFASAWAEFNDAAELARERNDSREAIARSRAQALVPKLSKLHLVAPRRPIPGLIVKRDSVDVTVLVGTDMVVDPGAHTIVVSAPDHVDWKHEVTLVGTTTTIEIPPLEQVPTKPGAVDEGTLTIRSQPDAEIFIDSLRVGVGSYTGTLKSGGHTLRVVAPNMRPYQTEIVVGAAETRTIDVPLEPPAGAEKPTTGRPRDKVVFGISAGASVIAPREVTFVPEMIGGKFVDDVGRVAAATLSVRLRQPFAIRAFGGFRYVKGTLVAPGMPDGVLELVLPEVGVALEISAPTRVRPVVAVGGALVLMGGHSERTGTEDAEVSNVASSAVAIAGLHVPAGGFTFTFEGTVALVTGKIKNPHFEASGMWFVGLTLGLGFGR